jgi:hypothetical protein
VSSPTNWKHHQRELVWWLFDHAPKRVQDWAESWARTLIVRRQLSYKAAIKWARTAPVPNEDELMTAQELTEKLSSSEPEASGK